MNTLLGYKINYSFSHSASLYTCHLTVPAATDVVPGKVSLRNFVGDVLRNWLIFLVIPEVVRALQSNPIFSRRMREGRQFDVVMHYQYFCS
jgi:hypothetical protein